MPKDYQTPTLAKLLELDLLIEEQQRLLNIATNTVQTLNLSDPEAATAHLRLELLHGISAALVHKRNALRHAFVEEYVDGSRDSVSAAHISIQ
jgi:hypothetical protein